MKYITSVNDNGSTKHIVEINGVNNEVVLMGEAEKYGDKKGENYFFFNGVCVYQDLTFKPHSSYSSIHLATAVLAIEVVRFVMKESK